MEINVNDIWSKRLGFKKGTFVVTEINNDKQKTTIIKCELCNNQRSIRWSGFIKQTYKALCDCQKQKGNRHYAWKGCGELSHNSFRRYYHSSMNRNLEFSITIEDAWKQFEKQQRKCALSGWDIKLEQNYNKRHEQTASLDRIDSIKGYTKDNIQWVHRDINYIKGHCDNDYFIEICNSVAKTNKAKIESLHKPIRYDRYKWKEKQFGD